MRLAGLALVVLLSGCAREPEHPKFGLILLETTPPPPQEPLPFFPERASVTFEIQWIRDWDSPYFINGVETVEMTAAKCIRYGVSNAFFAWCLLHVPPGGSIAVQLPKPVIL